MSTDTQTTAEKNEVDRLAAELGEAIGELPVYERYERAREAVANDDEAQERIAEFERLREELTVARQTGQVTDEAVRKVREAQRELHELPVMAEYLDAEEALQTRLESLNRTISQPLSVDFGGEAGGCCQD